MTWITLTLLALIVIVLKTFKVVHQRHAFVKERLGKFAGVLEPGFHFLIPFIDRVAYRQEMREQVFDVPSQICITRDNIQVDVDGLVYLQVMDPQKASYGIEDYQRASINLAQTTMRSEIGKLTLHQSFSEREKLNESIVREVDKASNPWGIKVLRYELRNITPSSNVVHTLEQQMEAEREKRADVTTAEANKEATIQISKGERQAAINISEGEKIRRINEAEGRAKEITLLAEASAYGIRRVGGAILKPGGQDAVRMRILEEFIDEFGKILQGSQVSVVPHDLANIQGVVAGLSRTGDAMAPKGGQ